ncbi:unnamed protein product [Caenorhabditis brenneri]
MSKTEKFKQTVLKDHPIENAHLSFLNNEYIKWEMSCQNGTVLRSNRYFILEERLVVDLKFNYFVIDEVECQENVNVAMGRPAGSIQGLQSFQSATKFSNLTRKNVYLLAFPIAKMMLRPQESLRVFTDSVLEYIPILLRQQGTPIDENDKKLKKYEKSWKTSQNHLYNTIEIEELNKVLEDFDINKSAISLVLDPVYSETSVQMLEKGSDPIYTISPDGEEVLGVFQAAHYIFQCLVCGIDWTSKIYKNQLDGLKRKILRVMNKYCNVQENLCVSKKSIDEDIQVVKSDKRFLQHKKPFELWSGLNTTDNISIDTVIAFLNSFSITFSTNPECPLFSMKLCGESHIEIWMARWITIDAWTQVFFKKDNEKLKAMVRDSLGVRISESNREALIKGTMWKKTITPEEPILRETEKNFFVRLHIQSEKDGNESEEEKGENVLVHKTKVEERVKQKNTETSSQSRPDDFEQNLRNAMRKKRELQKKKAEKQSPGSISQEVVQVAKSPDQKQSDTETEELQKLKEEIEKLKEKVHQLQITSDLTKSTIENERTKIGNLKKRLESSNTNLQQDSEDLDLD